jgi:type I restriction enzyme M protein
MEPRPAHQYASHPGNCQPINGDSSPGSIWSEANPQGRWRPYRYEDLLQPGKVSLDIFWHKDDSLEDSANLEDPDVIAAEIALGQRAALEEFELILGDLST